MHRSKRDTGSLIWLQKVSRLHLWHAKYRCRKRSQTSESDIKETTPPGTSKATENDHDGLSAEILN